MSRMVKLKSNRRKSRVKVKVKATVSGLALALTIGAVGSMGSYAYFVDKAKAQNDLVITMGNLNTDIAGRLDMDLNKDNKCVTQTFNIKNNGSLKQNVALGFSENSKTIKNNRSLKENIALGIYKNISNMNASQLENLSCTLNISYNGKAVIPKGYSVNTFNDLINMENKELIYSNGKTLVSLDPNKELNCTVSVSIKDGLSEEQMKSLQEKQFGFDTEVDAIQINTKGGSNNEI